MNYCPNCQLDYSGDVFICSECGGRLVADLSSKASTEVGEGILELKVLARFATSAEADMVREILETNGIRTLLRGEGDPIGAASQAAPITLLIEKRNFAEADEIYKAFFTGTIPEDNWREPE